MRRLDPYPSAPSGGPKGSKEAEERLAWVRARNRLIAGVPEDSGDGDVHAENCKCPVCS